MNSTVASLVVVARGPGLVPLTLREVFGGVVTVGRLDSPVDVGVVGGWREVGRERASVLADGDVTVDGWVADTVVGANLGRDGEDGPVVDGLLVEGN